MPYVLALLLGAGLLLPHLAWAGRRRPAQTEVIPPQEVAAYIVTTNDFFEYLKPSGWWVIEKGSSKERTLEINGAAYITVRHLDLQGGRSVNQVFDQDWTNAKALFEKYNLANHLDLGYKDEGNAGEDIFKTPVRKMSATYNYKSEQQPLYPMLHQWYWVNKNGSAFSVDVSCGQDRWEACRPLIHQILGSITPKSIKGDLRIPATAEDLETVEDHSMFRIKKPKGWPVKKSDPPQRMDITNEDAVIRIETVDFSEPTTAEQFMEQRIQERKRVFKKQLNIQEQSIEDTSLGGLSGKSMKLALEPKGTTTKICTWEYWGVKNQKGFYLQFTWNPVRTSKYESTFQRVRESVQFK